MIEAYNAKAKTEVRIIPLFMGRGLRQRPALASAINVVQATARRFQLSHHC